MCTSPGGSTDGIERTVNQPCPQASLGLYVKASNLKANINRIHPTRNVQLKEAEKHVHSIN